jgi:hypothetical protein
MKQYYRLSLAVLVLILSACGARSTLSDEAPVAPGGGVFAGGVSDSGGMTLAPDDAGSRVSDSGSSDGAIALDPSAECLVKENKFFMTGSTGAPAPGPGPRVVEGGPGWFGSVGVTASGVIWSAGVNIGTLVTAQFSTSDGVEHARPLVPGTYTVDPSEILDASRPMFGVGIDSALCDYPTGHYQVLVLDASIDGSMREFTATFEQHCGVHTAIGCVHFSQ